MSTMSDKGLYCYNEMEEFEKGIQRFYLDEFGRRVITRAILFLGNPDLFGTPEYTNVPIEEAEQYNVVPKVKPAKMSKKQRKLQQLKAQNSSSIKSTVIRSTEISKSEKSTAKSETSIDLSENQTASQIKSETQQIIDLTEENEITNHKSHNLADIKPFQDELQTSDVTSEVSKDLKLPLDHLQSGNSQTQSENLQSQNLEIQNETLQDVCECQELERDKKKIEDVKIRTQDSIEQTDLLDEESKTIQLQSKNLQEMQDKENLSLDNQSQPKNLNIESDKDQGLRGQPRVSGEQYQVSKEQFQVSQELSQFSIEQFQVSQDLPQVSQEQYQVSQGESLISQGQSKSSQGLTNGWIENLYKKIPIPPKTKSQDQFKSKKQSVQIELQDKINPSTRQSEQQIVITETGPISKTYINLSQVNLSENSEIVPIAQIKKTIAENEFEQKMLQETQTNENEMKMKMKMKTRYENAHKNYFEENTTVINRNNDINTLKNDMHVFKNGFQNCKNDFKKKKNDVQCFNNVRKLKRDRVSLMDRNLMEGLTKPIEIGKAERMMQMMGWKGGALGKTGGGLLEPLLPNIQYKNSTFGFGQEKQNVQVPVKKETLIVQPRRGHQYNPQTVFYSGIPDVNNISNNSFSGIPVARLPKITVLDLRHNSKNLKLTKKQRRRFLNKTANNNCNQNNNNQRNKQQIFKMNVLLHVLEFVKNDTEIELVFDPNLKRQERKTVHFNINNVLDENISEMELMCALDEEQLDIVNEIKMYNSFLLKTESVGEEPLRALHVYKEAPAYMYLVTPDDFHDDEETHPCDQYDDKATEKRAKIDGGDLNEIEDKTKNQQNDEKDSDISKLLKEYFIEFIKEKKYKEFRFLGQFSDEDTDIINQLLQMTYYYCVQGSCRENNDFEDISNEIQGSDFAFEVIYDNGSPIIRKYKKEETVITDQDHDSDVIMLD